MHAKNSSSRSPSGRKGNPVLIAILVAVVALVAAGAIAYSAMDRNLKALAKATVSTPDLAAIPDGAYRGSFEALPVRVTVEVTVKDRAMRDIAILRHDNGQGKPAERIAAEVLAAQRLDIDGIAGATYSSKAILKAVEAALASAKPR